MDPKLDPIKPIKGMLKFFRFCGLWPVQSKYRWIYYIYATIFHFLFTFGFIFFKLVNLIIETDIKLSTVGFFIFLAEISLIARIVNIIVNFDDVMQCLNLVKKINLFDSNESKIMNENLTFFSKVMTLYLGCGTTACLFSWGAPLFSSESMLPYPAWYPIAWKTNSQSYWIAYSYQVISVSFHAHGIILLQLFSIYLMAFIGAQLDVIKYRLENLGHSTTIENDEATELKFVACIKFHQEVIR